MCFSSVRFLPIVMHVSGDFGREFKKWCQDRHEEPTDELFVKWLSWVQPYITTSKQTRSRRTFAPQQQSHSSSSAPSHQQSSSSAPSHQQSSSSAPRGPQEPHQPRRRRQPRQPSSSSSHQQAPPAVDDERKGNDEEYIPGNAALRRQRNTGRRRRRKEKIDRFSKQIQKRLNKWDISMFFTAKKKAKSFISCAGTSFAAQEWPSRETDVAKSTHIWETGLGTMIFVWDVKWCGTIVVTRLFNDDETEDILSGILHSELDEGENADPYIQLISPNETEEHRYWSMEFSQLSGNLMILNFETAEEHLGLNVCLLARNVSGLKFFVLQNVSGQKKCAKRF